MTVTPARDDGGQMRLIGAVIALTMLVWLAANWAGGRFGWPPEYAFLADMAAIGALIWSLLVTMRIWRRRASGAPQGRASGAKRTGPPARVNDRNDPRC